MYSLTHPRSDTGSESSWDGVEDEPEEDLAGSDEEDDEDEPSAHPYQNLLKSLAESAPKTKKRKLESSETDEKPQKQARTEAEDDEDEPREDPDHVDEPEESLKEPAPEDLFDEDDDLDPSDPFESHFSNPDMKVVTPRLSAIQQQDWQIRRINSAPWRLFVNAPYTPDSDDVPLPKAIGGPTDLKLKKKLQENITEKWTEFNDIEKLLAPLVFNHFDTLFCERTISNSTTLRRMACLHALNQIFKYVTPDSLYKFRTNIWQNPGPRNKEQRPSSPL